MLALGVIVIGAAGCTGPDLGDRFTEHAIDASDYGLFDLGVVDADGDGLLDVFTSNHSGPQSLLLNRGGLALEEAFSAWGLDQDPEFPGLAVVPEPIEPAAPGLYVGWRGPALVVRAHGADSGASGRIELFSPVELDGADRFAVEVAPAPAAGGAAASTRITFTGEPGGHFAFVPLHHAVPITFDFDESADPHRIFVGPRAVTPPDRTFAVRMLDRHGMAWADYDGDSRTDVFITRGGLRGTIGESPLRFWNELYVQGPPGRMRDIGRHAGLSQGICPGRQAAWVDFDGDGRLDLYVVCGRDASGPDAEFANRLFRQTESGAFEDVARAVGLDLNGEGKAAWVDVDGDRDQDLVWAARSGFAWYENAGNRFTRHAVGAAASEPHVSELRIGDFDGDGDPDLLAVSHARSGNMLLVNDGRTLEVMPAAEAGLPSRSLTALWVDVDNDGIEELFAVPGGLYRKQPDGRYGATGVLDFDRPRWSPYELDDAHAAWADLDNDGARDLIVALNLVTRERAWARLAARLLGASESGEGALRGHWTTRLFRNTAPAGHWLEVALIGLPGNRPAVGARIRVEGRGVDRTAWVGQAEGARYSQGHYRAYFGLGALARLERLSVTWPDGHLQTIAAPGIDRLVTLRRAGFGGE